MNYERLPISPEVFKSFFIMEDSIWIGMHLEQTDAIELDFRIDDRNVTRHFEGDVSEDELSLTLQNCVLFSYGRVNRGLDFEQLRKLPLPGHIDADTVRDANNTVFGFGIRTYPESSTSPFLEVVIDTVNARISAVGESLQMQLHGGSGTQLLPDAVKGAM